MEKEFIDQINKNSGIIKKICNVYFWGSPYKEDYYQEIIIRVWKSFPNFKNQSSFSTWLYKVALNTSIDIIRKESISPKYTELPESIKNAAENITDPTFDNKDILYSAINQLKEIEKALIILYLDDYDYKEIAKIVGITETNVGVKINRIKNQLIKNINHGK